MDVIRIGSAIRTLRLQSGYTQHELAERIGVTDKAVSKWERGISIPDISLIPKLSLLLNCDIDNLLEGNITYLEKSWCGLLILEDNQYIYSGSEAYGKPLVHIYLSYFLLAGIANIYISCSEKDRLFICQHLGDGSIYGMTITFIKNEISDFSFQSNMMVVYDNPFVYGSNLTKYFQRAMSRQNEISILTLNNKVNDEKRLVYCDKYGNIGSCKNNNAKQNYVPILFFPSKYSNQIFKYKNINNLNPLHAEPMGNGIIEYSVFDLDSLHDTAGFLKFLFNRMKVEAYCLEEVAKNRNFM